MVTTRPDFGCCRLVKAGDDHFIIFQKETSTLYQRGVGPVGDAITNTVVTLLYIFAIYSILI
jgi:hypothetical protein